MTRKEALTFLSTKAWTMWKPGNCSGSFTDEEGWHREDIFAGVQVVCTRDEWHEIIKALGEDS